MTELTAVILAAGLGMRMGPRGRQTPKGLMELGGKTLVGRSVDQLQAAGIARVLIVTGHLSQLYQQAFADRAGVELIHNPDFGNSGSLKTLSVVLPLIDGPVVILESDLIYAPQVLAAINPDRNQFMVSSPTGAGDEVYTWIDPGFSDNRMKLISKVRDDRPETPFGEMIGVTVLSEPSIADMRAAADRALQHDPEAHYEAGLVELAQNNPIIVEHLGNVPWAEIDDEDMLARARKEVLPLIENAV